MEYDTTMAQEDQIRSCSNGGNGGGRSSKKPKQKKVPQRGLGVAQLEKIRLEEQQKRDSVSNLSSLADNNFHHSHQISSTIPPLPSGSPPEFRSPLSIQHIDAVPSTVPLANSGGFEAGWPPVSNVPKLWSPNEFDLEKDNLGVDSGMSFLPSLPFASSNPIWPLPNWGQRTPQYHQQPSSLVSVSSGTSSTPVPHFSLEPPSNQNYSGSSGVPMKPVEKVVGMKRPYPFSLDFPHAPAFNYNLPTYAEIRTTANTSCGSGSGFNFDPCNSNSREVPSCSVSNSEPNTEKRNKDTENFNGDFLTLAPPTSSSSSKFKSSSTFLAFNNQECPEYESLSSQEHIEDQIHTPSGYRLFNQQKQPLYSFFLPAAKEGQIGQTTARIQNCHEVGESIDLNLKL
ncbi:uncharacterized protein LOC133294907 isoform X1 [Gastrolobium bilobum]|uniref:uncharacterized protein LOC133294907 isoform X1 n=1 Tax=Gastrolobium bilobum TaxID=150636 RepID=UPI002AB1CE79|nr:uncharacterized protein LOC133294907 isoform X1 [Gastrolobium bilobum]